MCVRVVCTHGGTSAATKTDIPSWLEQEAVADKKDKDCLWITEEIANRYS
jgi:hypothetical protein